MRRVLVVGQRFPVAEPVKRGGVGQPVFEVFVPVFAGTRVGGDEELDVFAVGAAGEVVGEEECVHDGFVIFVGGLLGRSYGFGEPVLHRR